MPPHPKPVSYRNPDLLKAVSTVHCVSCYVWNHTQAAHIGGLAEGKGGAIKVADSYIAALCTVHRRGNHLVQGCHEQFDLHKIDGAFAWEFIAKTYIAMIESGVLRVDKKRLKELKAGA
jgi:hypothetical protein